MIDTIEIRVPCSGFYHYCHNALIDTSLENLFLDDCGNVSNWEEYNAAFDRTNWRLVNERYAQAYAEALADECNLSGLTFKRIISPREYNFSTDEIICDIPADTLRRMYTHVGKAGLAALVAERLKPCDGFIPFYSDDLANWGPFNEWEAPQIDLLVEAYCNDYCDAEWRDCYAMEMYSANGYFDMWLTEAGAFESVNKDN